MSFMEDLLGSSDWTQALLDRLLDATALDDLNRRYFAFVKALPSRLGQLAVDRKTVAGEGPTARLQTIAGFGFGIGIPWGFRDAFPRLDQTGLLDVGEAWIFLMLAILVRDHLADHQVPASPDVVELQQQLMIKARSVFHGLVGEKDAFWQPFEQYEQQLIAALELEAHYRSLPPEPFDLRAAWQIGCGKLASYKAIPRAMAVRSGEMAPVSKLEESMDALAAGRQMLDDAADWQEDLARDHYTYPLAQAVARVREAGKPISPQTIEAALSDSTILEDTLCQATTWHQQALAAVDGIPCAGWTDLVSHSMADCLALHRWLVLRRIGIAARARNRMASL